MCSRPDTTFTLSVKVTLQLWLVKLRYKRWPTTLQKRITGETSFSLVAAIQPSVGYEHNSQTQPSKTFANVVATVSLWPILRIRFRNPSLRRELEVQSSKRTSTFPTERP
jgi:hypothetical protein